MAEILHQFIGSLSHYLQGFIHPRWLAGFQPLSSTACLQLSQCLQSRLQTLEAEKSPFGHGFYLLKNIEES